MNKIFSICKKDLLITLNDRAALLFMFLAPFLLTLGMGAVTGSFSPQSSGLKDIPVILTNQDTGLMGSSIAEAFKSENLNQLLNVTESNDIAAARKAVEDNQTAALVIVPAGFSASLIPDKQTGKLGDAFPVEIYTSPARPISAGIVRSVVSEILNRVEAGPLSGEIVIAQLVSSQRLDVQNISSYANDLANRLLLQTDNTQNGLITVNVQAGVVTTKVFNPLAYLAPAMALVFLMYTVTQGGRSILAERDMGTLPRMLATPTSNAQVLGGKVLSIFVTGFLQVLLLVLASTMIFQLEWGDPVAVVLLVAAAAMAATGWGILLAAFVKTPFQAASLGTALMLLFGLLGGSFISTANFSPPVRWLSKITPNAWALDGFTLLGSGGKLVDIAGILGALLVMTIVLFGVSVLVARERWASGFVK